MESIISVINMDRKKLKQVLCRASSFESAKRECLARIDNFLDYAVWGLGDFVVVYYGRSSAEEPKKVYEGSLEGYLGGIKDE